MSAQMKNHILVMNRSWSPLAVTSVRRAMSLVFRCQARIVSTENFELFEWDQWLVRHSEPLTGDVSPPRYIRTVNLQIKLPAVVTLSRYNGLPSQQVPFSRRTLFRRDNYQCQYCGRAPGTRNLTIDHVLPRSRGGGTNWLNCVVSCVHCNVSKGNRTPDECGKPLRRHPFRPSWMDGFRVQDDIPNEWLAFVKE